MNSNADATVKLNLDPDLDPRTYHVGKFFFFSGKNHQAV